MIRTFLILRPSEPGFAPDRKHMVAAVRLRGETPQQSEQFFAQLFERLRYEPAIRDVGGSTNFPMSGITSVARFDIAGTMTTVQTNYPTAGYLHAAEDPDRGRARVFP